MSINKIIIIGAGVSGLTAAKKLMAHGYEVIILEARDRIGGRIHTDYSLGIPLDLGAGWVHGLENNPVVHLAKQYNARFTYFDVNNILCFTSDKKIIPKKNTEKVHATFEELLEHTKKSLRFTDVDQSLASALHQFDHQKKKPIFWQHLSTLELIRISLYAGAEAEHLSARYWDIEEILEGENHIMVAGYAPIVEGLAKECNIRLNQVVQKIKYDSKKVEIVTDSESFSADVVLVTISLGALKKNLIQFNPDLSKQKQNAINRLGMGVFNRIILKFPKIFWPENNTGLYLPSSDSRFSLYVNYYTFFQQPILVAVLSGEGARAVEKFNDEITVEKCMNVLRHYFGNNCPNPESVLISRWAQDPFSYGSYSFLPVGATGEDYDCLAEPIANRVFFAGEATYKKYLSTVHGAYFSGLREAERIIALAEG